MPVWDKNSKMETLGSGYERHEGACIAGSLGKRCGASMEGGKGSGPVLGHFT